MNEPTEYEMLLQDKRCLIPDIEHTKEMLAVLEEDLLIINVKLSYYSQIEN